MSAVREAVLTASQAPDEKQQEGFLRFLKKKYDRDIPLVFREDESIRNGFILRVGADTYDFTAAGRMEQLAQTLRQTVMHSDGELIPLLRRAVGDWVPQALANETGTVIDAGDGIAAVEGLRHAVYGEILLFEDGVRGMVQELDGDEAGCILFDSEDRVSAGSAVYRTGKAAGVPVGEQMLGRVVNALGEVIDGGEPIRADAFRRIENPAPRIADRSPVSRPLETGLLTVDSMFPIGRGQRELIIGDRQTGKTAIAVDTIINQKDKNVICIYVAVGQKAGSVAHLVQTLKKHDAMSYTVVINAPASDCAALQYIAPYCGCAVGEYFMEQGRDVLIVYDDLSKHAAAYRSVSLLLGRAPGREAYPGDVFYLHSRLLERAAQLSAEKGGGSMTALPIVETQSGDVSAYIPTNIISITDGQIFLESDLFFSGQRPAVNVGLSVSRVGGDAQTKAMKKAVGTLRLDLAQYREMKVFTRFAGELDAVTAHRLRRAAALPELLKQKQYSPLSHHAQVILLTVAMAGLLTDVPLTAIPQTKKDIVSYFDISCADICNEIDKTGMLTPETKQNIITKAQAYIKNSKVGD